MEPRKRGKVKHEGSSTVMKAPHCVIIATPGGWAVAITGLLSMNKVGLPNAHDQSRLADGRRA
jgi:hypothetical protein